MNKPINRKKILQVGKYLLLLAVAGGLLYISFKDIKWSDLQESLQQTNYWWIAASMAVGYAAFLFRARRWQFLFEPLGYKPSFKHTYDAVMLTYLANFAMPRFGEIARCGALQKTDKIPFESSLGTVVLERTFDMLCLIIITLTVVFFRIDMFKELLAKVWTQPASATNAGISYGIYIIVAAALVLAITVFIFRHKIKQWKITQKLKKIGSNLVSGLKSGFRLQQRGKFFFYTVLIWIAYWLQSYTVVKAMPDTQFLSGVDTLFLMIVGGLGWVVPVQGGIGAYHFLISQALLLYGIDKGVVFATISHETQALIMILFGFISFASVMLQSKRNAHG